MKVLLAHRYFFPDTPPYASMLRSIAQELTDAGHEVTVFTAQPSYGGTNKHESFPRRESMEAAVVLRARLLPETRSNKVARSLNLLGFSLQLFGHVLTRRRYDVVMAATTPPILVSLSARLAATLKGSKFVYHMQDIYPETVAAESGRPIGRALRVAQLLDKTTTDRADRVVVLSDDMRSTIKARGGRSENLVVINNFLPEDHIAPVNDASHKQLAGSATRPRIVFAGNLGRFQGLSVAVDAMHELGMEAPVELVFVGDGTERDALVRQSGALLDNTVFFMDRVSQREVEALVGQADAGLVSLRPGVIGSAYPSKAHLYLAEGIPIIATVEGRSQMAAEIQRHSIGTTCEPADTSALAMAFAKTRFAADDSAMRGRCASYGDGVRTRQERLRMWCALFESLDGLS